MTFKFRGYAQTKCTTLLGDNFGGINYITLYSLLSLILIGSASQYEGIYHLKLLCIFLTLPLSQARRTIFLEGLYQTLRTMNCRRG